MQSLTRKGPDEFCELAERKYLMHRWEQSALSNNFERKYYFQWPSLAEGDELLEVIVNQGFINPE